MTGRIGLRRSSYLAHPAYLASISASQSLIFKIALPDTFRMPWILALMCGHQPTNHYWKTQIQRQWDDIQSSYCSVTLRPFLDQHRLECLSLAAQPNSGAWVNCLLSTKIGTLLDNESFRIAISQRIGLPYVPHTNAVVEQKCTTMAYIISYAAITLVVVVVSSSHQSPG